MRQPTPSEEYITVIDNKGRRRVQRVQYIASDVRQEEVYVTTDGLAYAEDSLARKAHYYLIDELDRVPDILAHPDIVIYDPVNPDDTLIYYKHLYIQPMHIHQLVAVVVKCRQGIKFFYNLHPQQSGKVKGCRGRIRPKVWYIASGKKHRDFGI